MYRRHPRFGASPSHAHFDQHEGIHHTCHAEPTPDRLLELRPSCVDHVKAVLLFGPRGVNLTAD
jgi:hypothetical protein